MSVHRPAIRFTREAVDDYETILLYTEETWGEKQADNYWAMILRTLESLRDHPRIGHPREDLFLGCRSVRVQQHVIFYHLPNPDEIEVVRVLHGHQDAAVVRPPQ